MRAYSPYLMLILGALVLLAALASGLVRFGWNLPLHNQSLIVVHGGLMVCGVLGTLISLERAIPLRSRWAYAAPLLTAIGGLCLAAVPASPWPPFLIALGSVLLLLLFAPTMRSRSGIGTLIAGQGSLLWLIGNALWVAGWPAFVVVPWWFGFLLLSVAGRHLDSIADTGKNHLILLPGVALLLLGTLLDTAGFLLQWRAGTDAAPLSGDRLIGLAMLMLALWFFASDTASRRLNRPDRFVPLCLLSAYLWLAVSGLLLLATGQLLSGPLYDAVLHAFFAGFVAAAIFGHIPQIIARALDRPVVAGYILFFALALLHLGLLLRVGGDLLSLQWFSAPPAQQWGGLFNALAILLYLVGIAYAARTAILAGLKPTA